MNKFIKYAIVGLVGYTIGQLDVKYRVVRYALDKKLKEGSEQEENEGQK